MDEKLLNSNEMAAMVSAFPSLANFLLRIRFSKDQPEKIRREVCAIKNFSDSISGNGKTFKYAITELAEKVRFSSFIGAVISMDISNQEYSDIVSVVNAMSTNYYYKSLDHKHYFKSFETCRTEIIKVELS